MFVSQRMKMKMFLKIGSGADLSLELPEDNYGLYTIDVHDDNVNKINK